MGSSVALRALANRNRQSSRPWLNCSIHRRGSAVCRERCTQTGSRRNPTMESHPPTRHSKKTVCDTRLTKCIFVPKMHFASFYLLQKALLESLLWSKWAPFGRFLPYYGSKNSRKLLYNPPKNQPKMRQNHPKMRFGGILDRLEAISIPSISIYKGIKNK